jgi:hypothetical protein
MKTNQVAAAITFAATLLAAGTAFAAGPTNAEYYPFQETTTAKTTDKSNGADMSTKQSSSASSSTKTMGAQGHVSTDNQAREILMYLKAGG